jgi:DNA polymerase III delta subunit
VRRGGAPNPFRGWLEEKPAAGYLLAGDGAGLCDLLAELWLERFRRDGTPTDVIRWTVPDMERESPSAAWRSPSFFAQERIFVLPDLAEMKKAMRDEAGAYLRSPDPTVLLVIPCTDRKHAQTFSSLPSVRALALREEEAASILAGHAVAFVRASGASLAADAAAFLVRWIGMDYARLKGELGKLLAFAGGGGEIGEAEIRQVCIGRGGADPFALADAILKDDAAGSLGLVRAFAARAETGDYHALVGAIAWKTRMGSGGRGKFVAPEKAGRILAALSRIDKELKGGSALSPEQVFEINLLKLLT